QLERAQEAGQQHPRALYLVRLHGLPADEVPQEVRVRIDPVVPGRLTAEHEEVQAAEQPQRPVPRRLAAEDFRDGRVVRETPAEVHVERRAALALPGLLLEDLLLRQTVSSADFACCAIAPNACGSLTASSASTFRSSGISALRKPAMNWLYESPFSRAAALMRMIQSRRNVRFLFLRSRYA